MNIAGGALTRTVKALLIGFPATVLIFGRVGLCSAADKVLHCPGGMATVTYATVSDAHVGCLGVQDAVTFLRSQGIRTNIPIDIHMVDALPEGVSKSAIGRFDTEQRRATVLGETSSRNLLKGRKLFGMAFDAALHRSVVAHETAHIIAGHNFEFDNPARAASEYIAYVTQIASLPQAHRREILDRFPTIEFDEPMEINIFILMLNPNVFAVGSYRHFLKFDNQKAFFGRLIRGDVRLETLNDSPPEN